MKEVLQQFEGQFGFEYMKHCETLAKIGDSLYQLVEDFFHQQYVHLFARVCYGLLANPN